MKAKHLFVLSMESKLHKKGKGNHGLTLSTQELDQLLQLVNNSPSRTTAAISCGIDRNVLDRVLLTGRGSKITIGNIKNAIHDHSNN